jgi:hypothetical protein
LSFHLWNQPYADELTSTLSSDPNFLYVASSMTACAAFSEESRMRLANAPEVNRKSGGPEADFEKMGLSAEAVSRFVSIQPANEQRLQKAMYV